jgi:hypothetical protein
LYNFLKYRQLSWLLLLPSNYNIPAKNLISHPSKEFYIPKEFLHKLVNRAWFADDNSMLGWGYNKLNCVLSDKLMLLGVNVISEKKELS